MKTSTSPPFSLRTHRHLIQAKGGGGVEPWLTLGNLNKKCHEKFPVGYKCYIIEYGGV